MSQKGNISALESQVGQNVNPKSLWIKLNGISGGGGERRAARQHDQVLKKIIDNVFVVNTIIFILLLITIIIPVLISSLTCGFISRLTLTKFAPSMGLMIILRLSEREGKLSDLESKVNRLF